MKSNKNKDQFVLIKKEQLESLLYSYYRDNVLANMGLFEDEKSVYSDIRDEYLNNVCFGSLDELVKNKQFAFIISDTFVGPIYETKELAEQTRNCFDAPENIFVLSLAELNVLVFSYYRDDICEEIREQFDVAYEEEKENYFEHLSEMSSYDIKSYEDLIKLEFESEEAKTTPLPFFRETFLHVNESEQNGNPNQSQNSNNDKSVISNNLFLLRCNKIY